MKVGVSVPPEVGSVARAYVKLVAVAVFVALVGLGSEGYYVLGRGRWSFGDCTYMTVITISTVGFGEEYERQVLFVAQHG